MRLALELFVDYMILFYYYARGIYRFVIELEKRRLRREWDERFKVDDDHSDKTANH